MAALGRWGAVDPLADRYAGHSPYSYVLGNPNSLIDPDGMQVADLTAGSMEEYGSNWNALTDCPTCDWRADNSLRMVQEDPAGAAIVATVVITAGFSSLWFSGAAMTAMAGGTTTSALTSGGTVAALESGAGGTAALSSGTGPAAIGSGSAGAASSSGVATTAGVSASSVYGEVAVSPVGEFVGGFVSGLTTPTGSVSPAPPITAMGRLGSWVGRGVNAIVRNPDRVVAGIETLKGLLGF
jgi:hypothetical protein